MSTQPLEVHLEALKSFTTVGSSSSRNITQIPQSRSRFQREVADRCSGRSIRANKKTSSVPVLPAIESRGHHNDGPESNSAGSVSQRQLDMLPSFTCFCLELGGGDGSSATNVSSASGGGALFAGNRSGEVFLWTSMYSRRSTGQERSKKQVPSSPSSEFPMQHGEKLGSHKGPVTSIAYHRHYRRLITGGADATIRLWSPFADTSGEIHNQTIPAHEGTVTNLVLHCNVFISASVDKSVKLWKFEDSGVLAHPWVSVKQVFVFDAWITSLWASPDKSTEDGDVIVGDAKGCVTVLRSVSSRMDSANRVSGLELVRHCSLADSEIAEMDQMPLGITKLLPLLPLNIMFVLTFGRTVKLLNPVTLQQISEIEHPLVATPHGTTRFLDVVWVQEKEVVLLLDNRDMIYVYSMTLSKYVGSRHVGVHSTTLLLSDATQIFPFNVNNRGSSGSLSVRQFLVCNRLSIDWLQVLWFTSVAQVDGHGGRIIAILAPLSEYDHRPYSSDGSGEDSDCSTLQHKKYEKKAASVVTAEGFAFVSAAVDNTVCFWSSGLQNIKTLHEKTSEISAMVLTRNGYCVTGHDNGYLKFWNLMRDDNNITYPAHKNTVTAVCLAFHRFDKGVFDSWDHLFSVSFDGCLALWHLPDDSSHVKCEVRVRISNSELICAAYDSVKYAYVVGDSEGMISIWSVNDLQPIRFLRHTALSCTTLRTNLVQMGNRAHNGAVTCIVLDGNVLFSGGEDEQIIAWNTAVGEPLNMMTSLEASPPRCGTPPAMEMFGEVQQLAVIPETGHLIACTRAGVVIVVDQRGRVLAKFEMKGEASAVAWSRSSSEIMVGLDSGKLQRIHWDAHST